LLFVILFAGIAAWKWRDAENEKSKANAHTEIAQGNLKTARHSVDVMLRLYLELPSAPARLQLPQTLRKLVKRFRNLSKMGCPHLCELQVARLLPRFNKDECIKVWEKSSNEKNDESAQQCKQAILELVKETKMAWESRSSAGPTPNFRTFQIVQQNKLEREIISMSRC